jgi:hypothetical protein
MTDRFGYPTYLIRKKILKLFGGAFHIYGPGGELLFYSQMKAFKLREDIRLYSGEDMQSELLTIRARQIIDFSATYDVVDATTGERVGALRRKGGRSIVRDEWGILDASDREIGMIQEDSLLLALLRRFASSLIPENYSAEIEGIEVASFRGNFNPFVTKITADFSGDGAGLFDRRLGIAAGILLCAIEGKQDSYD